MNMGRKGIKGHCKFTSVQACGHGRERRQFTLSRNLQLRIYSCKGLLQRWLSLPTTAKFTAPMFKGAKGKEPTFSEVFVKPTQSLSFQMYTLIRTCFGL